MSDANSGFVYMARGRGDGTLQNGVYYGAGNHPSSLALGDCKAHPFSSQACRDAF